MHPLLAPILSSIPSPGSWGRTYRLYGIMIALGVIAGLELARRRWQKRGGNPDDMSSIALWAVPAELVSSTSAATTRLESPFTGNRACSPKTPARSEPAKYCWYAVAASTVMLPGAMVLPEESKKLNTIWEVLRVLSQPLI